MQPTKIQFLNGKYISIMKFGLFDPILWSGAPSKTMYQLKDGEKDGSAIHASDPLSALVYSVVSCLVIVDCKILNSTGYKFSITGKSDVLLHVEHEQALIKGLKQDLG